jgi:hypothetical protein
MHDDSPVEVFPVAVLRRKAVELLFADRYGGSTSSCIRQFAIAMAIPWRKRRGNDVDLAEPMRRAPSHGVGSFDHGEYVVTSLQPTQLILILNRRFSVAFRQPRLVKPVWLSFISPPSWNSASMISIAPTHGPNRILQPTAPDVGSKVRPSRRLKVGVRLREP